jgi:hypothetical protein
LTFAKFLQKKEEESKSGESADKGFTISLFHFLFLFHKDQFNWKFLSKERERETERVKKSF